PRWGAAAVAGRAAGGRTARTAPARSSRPLRAIGARGSPRARRSARAMGRRGRPARRAGPPPPPPPPGAGSRPPAHGRVGLLLPEPHIHLTVHRRRRAEVLLRPFVLVGAAVELAEAEVAVGDDWAHAERAGESQRFAV